MACCCGKKPEEEEPGEMIGKQAFKNPLGEESEEEEEEDMAPEFWGELTMVSGKFEAHNAQTLVFSHESKLVHPPPLQLYSITIAADVVPSKLKGSTTLTSHMRKYAPVSLTPNAVKILVRNDDPEGDNDSRLSAHLAHMKPGATVAFKIKPNDSLLYAPNSVQKLILICAGTGIGLTMQLIERIISNKMDKTKLKLLYANKTEADILMRERLDTLAEMNPDQFSYDNILSEPDVAGQHFEEKWGGERGFVDMDVIKKFFPENQYGPEDYGPDMMKIILTGPPKMMESLAGKKADKDGEGGREGILTSMGYDPEQVWKF